MKSAILLCIALCSLMWSATALAGQTETSAKPNFILIFTDDQGYNDLGCFGSKSIKTPYLDQLAEEGRRFTNFHVPCSVCSPSRAALLTGSYPKRVGMHRHVLFPESDYGLLHRESTATSPTLPSDRPGSHRA